MREFRRKKVKIILYLVLVVCFLGVLHVGFTQKTLSAGFTGTFQCNENDGDMTRTYYLTVVPEDNVFYLYNSDIDLYRKGSFERIDLKNYTIEGQYIEKQNIELDKGEFSMWMDGKNFVFEKTSDTTVFNHENIRLLAE